MYKCCQIKHPRIYCSMLLGVILILFCAVRENRSISSGTDEKAVFLPVIMYHSIYECQPHEYAVTPSQAEEDLKWLKSHGYSGVSAKQIIDYTNGIGDLPEKPVMITADDGFYNNYSQLLPLLEKYDMCAVISIVGRFTDVYAENDPHNDAYSYLTWDDINKLVSSGRIEIGNHTFDMHSLNSRRTGCKKLEEETETAYQHILNSDISKLQTEITEHTGIYTTIFTYPFGAVSKESVPVIRDNGFLMTLTCREGANYIIRDPECLYGIFRYNRSGLYSTEEFMKKITESK